MCDLYPIWPETATPSISHDLPYSKDVFETLQHEGAQADNRSIGQLSQKIPF